MAMLAEPRRKKQYVLQPRGKPLYEDELRFGSKMLHKMGWSKGKGLGATENGNTEFVRVNIKNDATGLGFEDRDDHWTQHEEGFNGLLQSLQNQNNTNDDTEFEENRPALGFGFKETKKHIDAKETLSGQSLEQKSKQSKVRVHYKKFTRGKDISQYSEKDLANIFGKKALAEVVTRQNEKKIEEDDTSNYTEDPMLHVTNTTVTEYFKQKMSVRKESNKCMLNGFHENNEIVNVKSRKKQRNDREEPNKYSDIGFFQKNNNQEEKKCQNGRKIEKNAESLINASESTKTITSLSKSNTHNSFTEDSCEDSSESSDSSNDEKDEKKRVEKGKKSKNKILPQSDDRKCKNIIIEAKNRINIHALNSKNQISGRKTEDCSDSSSSCENTNKDKNNPSNSKTFTKIKPSTLLAKKAKLEESDDTSESSDEDECKQKYSNPKIKAESSESSESSDDEKKEKYISSVRHKNKSISSFPRNSKSNSFNEPNNDSENKKKISEVLQSSTTKKTPNTSQEKTKNSSNSCDTSGDETIMTKKSKLNIEKKTQIVKKASKSSDNSDDEKIQNKNSQAQRFSVKKTEIKDLSESSSTSADEKNKSAVLGAKYKNRTATISTKNKLTKNFNESSDYFEEMKNKLNILKPKVEKTPHSISLKPQDENSKRAILNIKKQKVKKYSDSSDGSEDSGKNSKLNISKQSNSNKPLPLPLKIQKISDSTGNDFVKKRLNKNILQKRNEKETLTPYMQKTENLSSASSDYRKKNSQILSSRSKKASDSSTSSNSSDAEICDQKSSKTNFKNKQVSSPKKKRSADSGSSDNSDNKKSKPEISQTSNGKRQQLLPSKKKSVDKKRKLNISSLSVEQTHQTMIAKKSKREDSSASSDSSNDEKTIFKFSKTVNKEKQHVLPSKKREDTESSESSNDERYKKPNEADNRKKTQLLNLSTVTLPSWNHKTNSSGESNSSTESDNEKQKYGDGKIKHKKNYESSENSDRSDFENNTKEGNQLQIKQKSEMKTNEKSLPSQKIKIKNQNRNCCSNHKEKSDDNLDSQISQKEIRIDNPLEKAVKSTTVKNNTVSILENEDNTLEEPDIPNITLHSNLKALWEQLNTYKISSFSAEKFRRINCDGFQGANLVHMDGYSFDKNFKLDINVNERDEQRILQFWKGTTNKYKRYYHSKINQPKNENNKSAKNATVKKTSSKAKKSFFVPKAHRRKNVFKLGI